MRVCAYASIFCACFLVVFWPIGREGETGGDDREGEGEGRGGGAATAGAAAGGRCVDEGDAEGGGGMRAERGGGVGAGEEAGGGGPCVQSEQQYSSCSASANCSADAQAFRSAFVRIDHRMTGCSKRDLVNIKG